MVQREGRGRVYGAKQENVIGKERPGLLGVVSAWSGFLGRVLLPRPLSLALYLRIANSIVATGKV